MVNTSELIIDEILKHHRDSTIRFLKKRVVPSDVLTNIPEGPRIRRLRGAGAEDLGAGEPDGGDTVVLVAVDVAGEVEDSVRPRRRACRRRGVGDGDRRLAVGVGEGVLEERECAVWGRRRKAGGRRRESELQRFLGLGLGLGRVVEGFGGVEEMVGLRRGERK